MLSGNKSPAPAETLPATVMLPAPSTLGFVFAGARWLIVLVPADEQLLKKFGLLETAALPPGAAPDGPTGEKRIHSGNGGGAASLGAQSVDMEVHPRLSN